MREILFRGKIENAGWVYGCYFKGDDGDAAILRNEKELPIYVIPKTIGQYTGVKDCEGKKIFEGDVLDMIPAKPQLSWVGPVEYDLHGVGFIVSLVDDKGKKVKDLSPCCASKIIGDIYNNQELLEEA